MCLTISKSVIFPKVLIPFLHRLGRKAQGVCRKFEIPEQVWVATSWPLFARSYAIWGPWWDLWGRTKFDNPSCSLSPWYHTITGKASKNRRANMQQQPIFASCLQVLSPLRALIWILLRTFLTELLYRLQLEESLWVGHRMWRIEDIIAKIPSLGIVRHLIVCLTDGGNVSKHLGKWHIFIFPSTLDYQGKLCFNVFTWFVLFWNSLCLQKCICPAEKYFCSFPRGKQNLAQMTLKTNKKNRKSARSPAKAEKKVLLPKTVKKTIYLGAPRGDGHFQNGHVTICHLVLVCVFPRNVEDWVGFKSVSTTKTPLKFVSPLSQVEFKRNLFLLLTDWVEKQQRLVCCLALLTEIWSHTLGDKSFWLFWFYLIPCG